MPDPGFMIPLNQRDFEFRFDDPGTGRDICSTANEQKYTKAPWWTCENIQLTGSVDAVTARVGDTIVIQVGIEGLPSQGGDTTPAFIQNVQAWVCYPNTVAGGASATLVVPSMQNNKFASFSNTTASAPLVFYDGNITDYQNPKEGGFALISLSPWTPTQEDFLEQSQLGGIAALSQMQPDNRIWKTQMTQTAESRWAWSLPTTASFRAILTSAQVYTRDNATS